MSIAGDAATPPAFQPSHKRQQPEIPLSKDTSQTTGTSQATGATLALPARNRRQSSRPSARAKRPVSPGPESLSPRAKRPAAQAPEAPASAAKRSAKAGDEGKRRAKPHGAPTEERRKAFRFLTQLLFGHEKADVIKQLVEGLIGPYNTNNITRGNMSDLLTALLPKDAPQPDWKLENAGSVYLAGEHFHAAQRHYAPYSTLHAPALHVFSCAHVQILTQYSTYHEGPRIVCLG